MYIGTEKFELMRKMMEFLGVAVGIYGIEIGDERKALRRDAPMLARISDVNCFLDVA